MGSIRLWSISQQGSFLVSFITVLLACIIAVVVLDFGLPLRISMVKYIQYST